MTDDYERAAMKVAVKIANDINAHMKESQDDMESKLWDLILDNLPCIRDDMIDRHVAGSTGIR